jgi:hypothetical protein
MDRSVAEGATVAPGRYARPAALALEMIAGDDLRPLLVLRECQKCSGTEDALMSEAEGNERTYLLSRWFRCVRLPPDVLEEDHPFRNLFSGEEPAHVFVANHDGSARHDLKGDYSRRELWAAMEDAIEANYEDASASAVQRLSRLLSSLDDVDVSISDAETRLELALSGGAGAKKAKALDAEIAERRLQRDELLAAAEKVPALKPRPLTAAR